MKSMLVRNGLLAAAASAVLAGCGGGGSGELLATTPTQNVVLTGQIIGLTGSPAVLANGASQIDVASNGRFSFGAIPQNSWFNVVVVQPPLGKICTVANGWGTAVTDVRNVEITCAQDPDAPTFSVGGTLAGLPAGATGLELELTTPTGTEVLPIPADGAFTFNSELLADFDYSVAIDTPPSAAGTSYNCALANATGTIVDADVASVEVTCSFAVGINVTAYTATGVNEGLQLALLGTAPGAPLDTLVPGAIPAGPPADIAFGVRQPSHSQAFYTVAIAQQPTGQTCVLKNAGSVALLAPADASLIVLCLDRPGAPFGSEVVTGTYKDDDSRTWVTFFEDGTFLSGSHSADPLQSGVEHGFYSLNSFFVPDSIVFHVLTDTNGVGGVAQPDPTAPFVTTAPVPAARSGGVFTGLLGGATAVASAGNLEGAWLPKLFDFATFGWLPPNNQSVLVYTGDPAGIYYSVANGSIEVEGIPLAFSLGSISAPAGTYTQNRAGTVAGLPPLDTGLFPGSGQPGETFDFVNPPAHPDVLAAVDGAGELTTTVEFPQPWVRSVAN